MGQAGATLQQQVMPYEECILVSGRGLRQAV